MLGLRVSNLGKHRPWCPTYKWLHGITEPFNHPHIVLQVLGCTCTPIYRICSKK